MTPASIISGRKPQYGSDFRIIDRPVRDYNYMVSRHRADSGPPSIPGAVEIPLSCRKSDRYHYAETANLGVEAAP